MSKKPRVVGSGKGGGGKGTPKGQQSSYPKPSKPSK
jgi:hypothetical protein